MPLRIVIDARRIRDFGVGTYIRNLLHSLGTLDQRNQYFLVMPAGEYPELASLPANFSHSVFIRNPTAAMSQVSFPLFLRGFRADLYHIPFTPVPWGVPKPYVVTVHDIANLLFSEKRTLARDWELFRARRALQGAARVIAVSQATRRDIETLLHVSSSRIRTIYNAPDASFAPSGPPGGVYGAGNGAETSAAVRRVLDRYQIHYPYLLYAGRTTVQKNLIRLVSAFSLLRNDISDHPYYRDLRLIIIGDEIRKQASLRRAVNDHRLDGWVRFLGFVPIDTLRIFYQAASAFVFPSLYEGFGLPPLEAMACGTPVVVSNASSLPEVNGDAAMFVDPKDLQDIARGIREVLLNSSLRGDLIRKGFLQAASFNWRQTAERVLETYADAARRGKDSA